MSRNTLAAESLAQSDGFLFKKDSSLSGFRFPESSFLDSWTVANPYLVPWILAFSLDSLDSVSFHTYLLENTDLCCPLYAISTVSFSFALRPALGCSSGFTSCLSREEKCFSRICCSQYQTTIFSDWCSLEIHPFEQHLECRVKAVASAAVTVEADDKTKFADFRRLAASSSR